MLVKDIVKYTGGTLLCGDPEHDITSFTQDSRKVQPGGMYIPIIGENHDGHDFIPGAFENGAQAVITQREMTDDTHDIILVDDTFKALGKMAAGLREMSGAKVIGITGSAGKTSTKDLVFSVVSQKYTALKTLGNYNNLIGNPLTLLRWQGEEVMVIEMGMGAIGDVDYLSNIGKPDIALITNIGTAHIGEIGSQDKIFECKMEITHGLAKDGVLIVNGDDKYLSKVEDNGYTVKKVTIKDGDGLKAYDINLGEYGSEFTVDLNGKPTRFTVPVAGAHYITDALLAIQTGLELDVPAKDIVYGVAHFELTKNRADEFKLDGDIRVIDGTYNANTTSMAASMDVLAASGRRTVAVFADMLEMGDYEEETHREVGAYAVKKKLDVVLTVGHGGAYIADEAKKGGINATHYEDNTALIKALDDVLQPGDCVLIKGSNGMHLGEVINHLKERAV